MLELRYEATPEIRAVLFLIHVDLLLLLLFLLLLLLLLNNLKGNTYKEKLLQIEL